MAGATVLKFQSRTDESIKLLTEAQARTDERLNIFINVVERHISGNGGSESPRLTATMQLARVIGTVVATIKNDSLEGRKLLVVQTLNKDLEPAGKPMVAVDSVGAGVGELVFWCRGKEASFPFKREDTPTDCTIIGIVDSDAHVTQGSRA